MKRLARSLVFVCGPDHPTTIALHRAAKSGSEQDIKKARFLGRELVKPSVDGEWLLHTQKRT